MKNRLQLFLSILSGLLLYAGWSLSGLEFLVFFAFVPLLYIEHQYSQKGKPSLKVFIYAYTAFFVWNLFSTWWIVYATVWGGIAAVVFNALFYTIVFWLFHITKAKTGPRFGDMAFIFYWIAFEYIYLHGEISWTWLVLGNAFANHPKIIQWYEYTGTLGGSLWILSINFIIYKFIICYRDTCGTKRLQTFRIVSLLAIIIIPIAWSIYKYNSFQESGKKVEIVVVQPNIDPYNEKFSESYPPIQQVNKIISLANPLITPNTSYIVAPETAIPTGIWEENLYNNYLTAPLLSYVKKHPNINIVIGATTYKNYGNKKETPTARMIRGISDTIYYDAFNTALQINTRNIDTYHKSKLVIGVEMLPYPNILGPLLQNFIIDLGGTTGSLGTQKERSVFVSNDSITKVGPVICYESIYGEFVTGYIKKGANILFVITNDGWWNDTPGYKQHLSYSRLRAIETRRDIARSANTGISAFINARGDILDKTQWWTPIAIKHTLHLHNRITFYVKHGDYIGRISLFFSVLLLISVLSLNFIKKKNRYLHQ